MVDEIWVLRLLRALTDDLAVLDDEAVADPDRRRDRLWMRGVKYSFVTAIEACVDVAQHVCAAEGWGPPKDDGDAMIVLAEHGVLSAELAFAMRRAVGFRNVLVHEYVTVDDAIVLRRLADLDDLRRFAAAVAAWLPPA